MSRYHPSQFNCLDHLPSLSNVSYFTTNFLSKNQSDHSTYGFDQLARTPLNSSQTMSGQLLHMNTTYLDYTGDTLVGQFYTPEASSTECCLQGLRQGRHRSETPSVLLCRTPRSMRNSTSERKDKDHYH
ncbi:hypothetical protein Mapa_001416 [Marchantia paleacea]|nr:hypothetical protein Mapa_001416 [Marchantia paleacea]